MTLTQLHQVILYICHFDEIRTNIRCDAPDSAGECIFYLIYEVQDENREVNLSPQLTQNWKRKNKKNSIKQNFFPIVSEWMRTLANGKVILSNLRIILFRNVKAEFDLECFYFRVVHAPVTEEKTLSSQPLHRELSLILKEIKVTENLAIQVKEGTF